MQPRLSYSSILTNNEEDSQQFSFKGYIINSIDELENEMNKISLNINTIETNWQSRVQSIRQLGNMISGDILNKYPYKFINLLYDNRDGICKQITELRSGVTKEIFQFLSFLAISIDENKNDISLKQEIQSFIDYIIPYILKQTKQTILVISHHSNITLRTIIKRIPIFKSIYHIIQNTNINQQKSICLRVRCMEYLQIMIEIQLYHNNYLQLIDNDHNNKNYMSLINESIINCISDPHQSVRYVARQCVWSLNKIYPNNKYSSYILSKISSQNAKYVLSEKLQYKMLPPPIGTGHKVELGKNNNKGLINSSSTLNIINNNNNNHNNDNKQQSRPKSALPSRKHRLELLKKKKREMAAKLRRQKNNNQDNNNNNNDIIVFAQRPQTAHARLISSSSSSIQKQQQPRQIGQAHRISIPNSSHKTQINNDNNDNDSNQDDTEDVIMKDNRNNNYFRNDMNDNYNKNNMNDNNSNNSNNHRMRKISIMGNATRFSSNNTPTPRQQMINNNKPKLSPAMRIETQSNTAKIMANNHNNNNNNYDGNLDDIIVAIHETKLHGINELSKWLQSNHNDCNNNIDNMSVILLAIGGFLDCIAMNKINDYDIYVKSMFHCINNLILYSSLRLTIQDLLKILSKLLRLFIKSNSIEYENNYIQYTQYFQIITQSLMSIQSQQFSFKSLINALSQTIIKPKQKLIWLHFISCYCKHSQPNNDWNVKLVNYLFNLLKECVMNPQFIEFHALLRSQNCKIVDDIIKYIIYNHNNEYKNIFKLQLNDQIIETLLGIIKNESIIQILQKYYSIHANPLNTPTTIKTCSVLNSNRNSRNNNNNNHSNYRYTTPSHQNKRYQRIRKAQIESLATPPLNMYMTTPAPIYNHNINNNNDDNNEKENDMIPYHRITSLNEMNDEQLINFLLNNKHKKSISDRKTALKYLSHRINGNKQIFNNKCREILLHIIDILNNDNFMLHRNSLRILQAICWFYPKCINENLQITLESIINLFRTSAPTESGELALDVITQFCKIVERELCINYLLPIIENEMKQETKRNNNNNNNNNGRKIFAALSIFDRIIVLSPNEWLLGKIHIFTEILIATYRYYREAMRSLIYLSIILNGDTSFLNKYNREQKIVEMMSKESDFTDWVKSHRINKNKH